MASACLLAAQARAAICYNKAMKIRYCRHLKPDLHIFKAGLKACQRGGKMKYKLNGATQPHNHLKKSVLVSQSRDKILRE